MNRLFLFLLPFTLFFNTLAQETKPNVVVILADDIGLGDISGYRRLHSDNIIVETPNIDALMNSGTYFTDGHSPTALCAPTRYSIMTGQNTYHSYAPWGVWSVYRKSPIKKTDATLGRIMKKAGYQTGFIGKWHLGGKWKKLDKPVVKINAADLPKKLNKRPILDIDISRMEAEGPKEMGFDYSFMLPAGIQAAPFAVYENEKLFPLKKSSKIGYVNNDTYKKLGLRLDKVPGLGDTNWNPYVIGGLISKKATNFIKNTKKDQPFFLYYCSQAVHTPHAPMASLDGIKIKGATPSPHLDMVRDLDAQIGLIVKALKAKGAYDNTLFIFTSDNGGLKRQESIKAGHRSSDIYTGSKNTITEGGHRIPFIVSWPNKIPSNKAVNNIISGTDILATIADAAQMNVPENTAKDSFNFLPLVKGSAKAQSRKTALFQGGTSGETAFRDGNWKLVMKYDKKDKTFATRNPTGLYNLAENIKETSETNLIGQQKYKKRVAAMFKEYLRIRDGKLAINQQ